MSDKDVLKELPLVFDQVQSGEWVQPRRKNYYMQCCDCGIVHRMNFRLVKDKLGRATIQMQAFRVPKKAKPFAVYEALQRKYFKMMDRLDKTHERYLKLKRSK